MKAVRYVGKATNLPPEYLDCIQPESGYVIVDTMPHGGNVTIRAELDGKSVTLRFDAATRDFLDLSALVYTVDEISEREKAIDHWSRSFKVVAPVADPSAWAANQEAFSGMLRTLAGDNYSFSWCARPNIGGYGKHRIYVPPGYDVVCLFSGGIDSFLGAYKLLSAGKRVLLVGHQADGTAASAQTELAEVLRQKFPGKVRLVQFRVARSMVNETRFQLPEKCEETHRPRSLLFLALAIGIAKSVRISSVYIPENGLIALNPPLGKSRLGSLSTRTAHPKYLTQLADFLEAAEIYDGDIKNPFLYESKTDMLLKLDASLHSALRRSVSCARPSRYKNLKVRHCGYCMPCIYRRIAMFGPNLDSAKDYAFDVFRNLPSIETSKQVDFRSLVAFAKKFLAAGVMQRELVVLAHGVFPLDAGARFGDIASPDYGPWSEMIERWAEDFLEKLRVAVPNPGKKIVGL